jgi:acyl carrier protein phosphodiesterase
MNYLAHLFFAHPTRASMQGNLLADFIRTPTRELDARYGVEVARGVRLHRLLDATTDGHAQTLHCIRPLFQKHRHVSRIIVDVCFDYYLSKHWSRFGAQPLDDFIDRAYTLLAAPQALYPPRFVLFVNRLRELDILRSYRTIDGLHQAYCRISTRLRHPTLLHEAAEDVRAHDTLLETGFLALFDELCAQFKRPDDSQVSIQEITSPWCSEQ